MGQCLFDCDERIQVQTLIVLKQLCQAHFKLTLLRLVDVYKVEVLLGLIANLADGFGSFFWEVASCCLCGQNHSIEAITYAFGHVAHLTARRSKSSLHRVHNLSLQYDWFANCIASICDIALHVNHIDVLLERKTQVAPSNHNSIRFADYIVNVRKAFKALNL